MASRQLTTGGGFTLSDDHLRARTSEIRWPHAVADTFGDALRGPDPFDDARPGPETPSVTPSSTPNLASTGTNAWEAAGVLAGVCRVQGSVVRHGVATARVLRGTRQLTWVGIMFALPHSVIWYVSA